MTTHPHPDPTVKASVTDELDSLRAENARLKAERDVLFEALEAGEAFGFDPATGFIQADDGGAGEHCVFYAPKAAEPDIETDVVRVWKCTPDDGVNRYTSIKRIADIWREQGLTVISFEAPVHCTDCPPAGYPTDITRCDECPCRGLSDPAPEEPTEMDRAAFIEWAESEGIPTQSYWDCDDFAHASTRLAWSGWLARGDRLSETRESLERAVEVLRPFAERGEAIVAAHGKHGIEVAEEQGFFIQAKACLAARDFLATYQPAKEGESGGRV